MTAQNERNSATIDEAREIVTTRVFDAPREVVFRAWTDPEHVSRWWGPRGFTTTTHQWDLKAGGVWRFTMHGPDGTDYKNRVEFLQVVPPSLLTYKHAGEEGDADVKFHTTVSFEEEGKGTRLTLRALFETAEERNRVAEERGAVEGAQQTLDRLGEMLATLDAEESDEEFVISRTFDAPRDLVFRVWTESEHLAHWWGPKGLKMLSCTNDPRPGGMMLYGMSSPSGNEMWGRWIYREIVPPERLSFVVSFSNKEGEITRAPFNLEWPLEVLTTITFTESEGRTLLLMRGIPINAREAERRAFAGFHASMRGGWGGTMDQLEAYLATRKVEAR